VNDVSSNQPGSNPNVFSLDLVSGQLVDSSSFSVPDAATAPYQITWNEKMSGDVFGVSVFSLTDTYAVFFWVIAPFDLR